MRNENSKCLVLNADFSPLSIISWKRALIWSIRYDKNHNMGIEIIDFYKNDFILGTNNRKYPIPAVVKTTRYFKTHDHKVNFSKRNLFIRDDYTCQYCGIKKDYRELTYDHVIPKSAWKYKNLSPTNWTNITTACVNCNRRKGNKTPKQANMPLKKIPIEPFKSIKYLPVYSMLFTIKSDMPEEWLMYLQSFS